MLWLVGHACTPVVQHRPALLTPARKAILDFITLSGQWEEQLDAQYLALAPLMPAAAETGEITDTVASSVVVTTSVGLTLTVPQATIPVAPPPPAPLPADFLTRLETLQVTHARLEQGGRQFQSTPPPPGMLPVQEQALQVVAAGLTWSEALQAYYAAPDSNVLPVLYTCQDQMVSAQAQLRQLRRQRLTLILSGGDW